MAYVNSTVRGIMPAIVLGQAPAPTAIKSWLCLSRKKTRYDYTRKMWMFLKRSEINVVVRIEPSVLPPSQISEDMRSIFLTCIATITEFVRW